MAYAFFQSDNFREKMRVATSNGTPLLDHLTILRLRLANREERARFRNAGNRLPFSWLISTMNDTVRRDFHWVPAEDEVLRQLAQSGETAANIAKQLHRSPGSVRNRASRLGIVIGRARKITLSRD